MKSNNELIAAVKLLEYRVHRLNRFLNEHGSTPAIILRTEICLIKQAYDQVVDIIEGKAAEE
jgi:hypothetical protein